MKGYLILRGEVLKKALLLVVLLMLSTFAYADYAWDFLRPFSNLAGDFKTVTSLLVFALSIGIFVISLKAYLRNKSKRLLFVSLAFFFFAAKWTIKIIDIFVSPGYFLNDPTENVFELAILLMLFIAIFRK